MNATQSTINRMQVEISKMQQSLVPSSDLSLALEEAYESLNSAWWWASDERKD